MNQLQIFNHPMFGELPVIIVNGVEWFGATEAAKALSFGNPYDALKNHVEKDDLADHEVIDRLGRKQQKKFTNESGLYDLIFGAAKQGNNPEIREKAKGFKKWVTSEVLPAIRKTGNYSIQQPKSSAEMLLVYAQQFVEQEKRLNQIESTVTTIQETFLQRDEDWRKSINSMINKAASEGGNYQELRAKSYELLEERARCKLKTRLKNLHERLEESGATKTKINNTSRMDVIEDDPRLKEIYTTIVKELSIGSLAVINS